MSLQQDVFQYCFNKPSLTIPYLKRVPLAESPSAILAAYIHIIRSDSKLDVAVLHASELQISEGVLNSVEITLCRCTFTVVFSDAGDVSLLNI